MTPRRAKRLNDVMQCCGLSQHAIKADATHLLIAEVIARQCSVSDQPHVASYPSPHAAGDLNATHCGKGNVEQYRVWNECLCLSKSSHAVVSRLDVVAVFAKEKD